MKKLFTLMAVTALAIAAFAQSPQKMSYQCVVRNSSGALVPNQAVGMRISILKGSATETVVFSETYSPNPQTNANGLVTVEIGSGTASVGTFAGIDWSVGPYFLKTETDPAGGTTYTITGTSQLLSVPYALYAKTAANGFSGAWADITGKPTFATVATSGSYTDLLNKPALFDGTWTSLTGKPTFATVATTGSYNDLLNKPALFDGTWNSLTGKPAGFADGIDNVDDADNSITNEIQSLSLSGTVLTLSNGGGTVTLPSSGGEGLTLPFSGSTTSDNPVFDITNTSTAVNTIGIKGKSQAYYGTGIYGEVIADGGQSKGVHGMVRSGYGSGVFGENTCSNVLSGGTGVRGEIASGNGSGVRGYASNISGTNYGVHGQTASGSGYGVYGEAPVYGVYGHSLGSTGRAVVGEATGTASIGVQGIATNTSSTGVWGEGANQGVYGNSSTATGKGVYGFASHTSGNNYGVYGESASAAGYAIYGKTTDGTGVYGYADGTVDINCGVIGKSNSSSGYGIYGTSQKYGTYGISIGSQGRAVMGEAQGTSSIGVYGKALSDNSTGVYGEGTNYDFYAAGPGVNYGNSSSIRWKRNIEIIPQPLEKIKAIKGVYFDWDEDHGGQHDVGMIAEEVGKVLPEIVVYEENGIDASGMDYSKITPLLLEAIKEQQKQIDELKALVSKLMANQP